MNDSDCRAHECAEDAGGIPAAARLSLTATSGTATSGESFQRGRPSELLRVRGITRSANLANAITIASARRATLMGNLFERRGRIVLAASDRRGHSASEGDSYTTDVPTVSNRKPALTEFVRRLRATLPDNVLDVRLYGSEARGDATPESDIDVFVLVQPDDQRSRLEDRIVDIAFDVNLQFDVFISPCVVTPEILNHPVWRETPFIETVLREGVPL